MAAIRAALRVAVASTNPVKVAAARIAVEKCFPDKAVDVIGQNVPSGVSDQPMTDAETRMGATNRARGAKDAIPDCSLYVGIEGGIEPDVDGKLICFAWVVVFDQDLKKEGSARSSTFQLPEEVSKLVRSGIELGVADDMVFKRQNSKHQGGTVGKLTNGLVDRTAYYEHTVLMALIPFINPDLY